MEVTMKKLLAAILFVLMLTSPALAAGTETLEYTDNEDVDKSVFASFFRHIQRFVNRNVGRLGSRLAGFVVSLYRRQ